MSGKGVTVSSGIALTFMVIGLLATVFALVIVFRRSSAGTLRAAESPESPVGVPSPTLAASPSVAAPASTLFRSTAPTWKYATSTRSKASRVGW